MGALLTSVSAVFSTVVGNVSTIATTLTAEGNEILLLPVGVMMASLAIGVFKRLTHVAG